MKHISKLLLALALMFTLANTPVSIFAQENQGVVGIAPISAVLENNEDEDIQEINPISAPIEPISADISENHTGLYIGLGVIAIVLGSIIVLARRKKI